jgi:hypothetical protein
LGGRSICSRRKLLKDSAGPTRLIQPTQKTARLISSVIRI